MTASRIAIAAFVGLCTISAFGQIPPPPPGSNDPTAPPGQTTGSSQRGKATDNRTDSATGNPTPGSAVKPGDKSIKPDAANGEKANKEDQNGPEILDDTNATPEQKASAEYSGPAVLSRGISASQPMNPKNVKFTPSVGLEYQVNSGLTGVKLDNNGNIPNSLSQGVQLTYSLTGEKVFRRDIFSLSFTGNINHYANQSDLDGTSNDLAMTWRHRLSKHLSFGIRQSLQEYTRNNLLLGGSGLINTGGGTSLVSATPLTEAFDGRVISLFNEGNITWQVNARLSFNLSGGGFMTRRASTSLYGDTGYQSGADVAYRITRRVTVGTYYAYTHFDFIGIYGGTDIQTVGIAYSTAFNPRTQLITRIGGSRLETTGLQSVQLDPVLQVLFGTPASVQAIYLKNYAPDFNLQLRHKKADVSVSLAYERGVTPGNGVILTSIRQTANVGIDYRARRRWNLSAATGWDTLSGFGAVNQRYSSIFLQGGVYRTIARHLDWHTRLDFHHYTFDNTGFLRNSVVFSTGVVWSPRDILERLW